MTKQSKELYEAVQGANRPVKVKALVDAGAVPDEETLLYALDWRNAEVIEILAKAAEKPTPAVLFKAVCGKDRPGIVKALIEGGAVPDEETLLYALDWRGIEVTVMLAKAAEKPTPAVLFKAVCSKDRPGIVKALIDAGAVPDKKTLQYAAEWRSAEVKAILLQAVEDNKAAELTAAYNKAAAEKAKQKEKEEAEMLKIVQEMQRQLAKPAARQALKG